METLERFQQSQRVIEDFTARTLAAIPSDYGRLYYVSSLLSPADGRYHHEGLTAVYPEGAVQQALEHCHGELFCKLLEMPLDRQEWDLRSCLGSLGRDFWSVVEQWRAQESYRAMAPAGYPDYLGELFRSNLRVLLEVIARERVSLPEVA